MEDLNLLERFAAHARDFVRTFIDDEWSHLEQYFPSTPLTKLSGMRGTLCWSPRAAEIR